MKRSRTSDDEGLEDNLLNSANSSNYEKADSHSKFTKLGAILEELGPILGKETEDIVSNTNSDENSPEFVSSSADMANWQLHPSLVSIVSSRGISQFFPIQRQVVPVLIKSSNGLDNTCADICVSAPTGSGKTLTYVLPILNNLLHQNDSAGGVVPRRGIRAIAIVPTRDLAQQVLAVFTEYSAGTNILISMAAGQTSFQEEQEVLVKRGCDILICTPGRLVDHLDSALGLDLSAVQWLVVDEADRLLSESYQDWAARVNSAIFPVPATQRDQVYSRNCFISSDNSIFNSVPVEVPTVLPDFTKTARVQRLDGSRVGNFLVPELYSPLPNQYEGCDTQVSNSKLLLQPRWKNSSIISAREPLSLLRTPFRVQFHRIVCSATLTTNPQKLAALGLLQPQSFFASSSSSRRASGALGEDGQLVDSEGHRLYTLPPGLHQSYVVVGAAEKPIALIHTLRMLEHVRSSKPSKKASKKSALDNESEKPPTAIVFTGSTETAHRLTRLLQLYGGLERRVVEFSADLSQLQRTAVLEAVNAGMVGVLVSSDAAARGIDIPSVLMVVHYDAAPKVKTYVHRVGRTARAGRSGLAVSLVRPEQVRHFKRNIARTISPLKVVKETIWQELIDLYSPRLNAVLSKLKEVIEQEKAGLLNEAIPVQPIEE